MKLKDRLKLFDVALGGRPGARVKEDVFKLRPDSDGVVRQPCWFCNTQVEFRPAVGSRSETSAGDAGLLMIELFGTNEHMRGLCHRDCAERAKGSLAL